MRILITHLTRMKAPYICLAGLDDENSHVRPVQRRQIDRALLSGPTGRITLGSIVDFGSMRRVGSPPEVEDRLFDSAAVRLVGSLGGAPLWTRLEEVASDSLTDVFGSHLEKIGHTYALPGGTGAASLGVIRPQAVTSFGVNDYGKLRVGLRVQGCECSLPVTDLRMWSADHETPDETIASRMASALMRDRQVLLSVGVGRAADVKGEGVERHWLQVNNLFLGPK